MCLKSMLRNLLPLVAVAFSTSAIAEQPAPIVEIDLTPEEVLVGEALTLRVSVYVPTWFVKPPTFPSFEVPNAITRLPPDSTRPATKQVGRDTWSGITRSYRIYPLMGASFRLENRAMDVQYADPGSDTLRVQVDTGDISFSAVVPAGAEGLEPYVAGTRFEVSRSLDGDLDSLAVGDAVVATYTAELDGLSAIFIPELVATEDVAGVSVYADQPMVEDGPPARRVEKLTFIFNAGGNFEIPAVSIDWWNTESGSVQTASLVPLPISVSGPALEAAGRSEERRTIDWKLLIIIAAGLVLVLRWLPGVLDRLRSTLKAREELERASESYAWKQASDALASGDAHRAHDALVRWLGRLDAGLDLRAFAASFGDETLASDIDTMYRSLYTDSNAPTNLDRIASGLGRARERCLANRVDSTDLALPPLNP